MRLWVKVFSFGRYFLDLIFNSSRDDVRRIPSVLKFLRHIHNVEHRIVVANLFDHADADYKDDDAQSELKESQMYKAATSLRVEQRRDSAEECPDSASKTSRE